MNLFVSFCALIDPRSKNWRAPCASRIRWQNAFALSLLLLAAFPQMAQAAATPWMGDAHAVARLITAVQATGSAKTIDGGLEIRLAPGWHTYWRTPGDAGVPLGIDWTGSENLAGARISWPAPKRLVVSDLQNNVYEHHVVFPISFELTQPGAPLKLHAAVEYAACAEVCVPYAANFDVVVPAGLATPSPEATLVAESAAQIPGPRSTAGLILQSATVSPHEPDAILTVRLRSSGKPFLAPDIFVEGFDRGSAGSPKLSLGAWGQEALFSIPIQGADTAYLSARPLTFTIVDGGRSAEFSATPKVGRPANSDSEVFVIFAVALLGGLILNVMPCVLPVLSLKLLAVVGQAGASRRQIRLGLLATALGIFASFGLLAGVLAGLKLGGNVIAWGIQFQWPWFVAGMAVLTTLFAANLWGWLPISLPQFVYAALPSGPAGQQHKFLGAFLTGAFATLLATPCSAPFVGTAIGFALAAGPGEIFAVFSALALGFASPYLIIGAFPGLVRFLPKPGPWMLVLRRLLGLALVGTAAWLLFVLAELVGANIALITATTLAAAVLLLALQSTRQSSPTAALGLRASNVALVAVALLAPVFANASSAAPPDIATKWRPFNLSEIKRLIAERRVVFVHVTAAWCLTCKVNEATALDREPISTRLFGTSVVAMRADWTKSNSAVAAYLQSFGRYGVPFDVVYGPGRPNGEPLPELLTADVVNGALDRASATQNTAR
ncbi:MAG: protein-disulfide reductase [Hyphomicrobium sp.]|nr:MAG: protein-disulfide reductase [Hyphomicrobium sp.]